MTDTDQMRQPDGEWATPDAPAPSFEKTYKRADGYEIGDYGWVTTDDFLADEEYPTEVVEETRERTAVRRFWHVPNALYSCDVDLDCDEDAVAWRQVGDKWHQVCETHDPESSNVE